VVSITPLTRKLATGIKHPRKTVKKYLVILRCRISGEPPPFSSENYDLHWNHVSFAGKIVLDLGADYGSTACYFHKKGASQVIAVEGNHEVAEKLKRYAIKHPFVIPDEKFIASPDDITLLINQHSPDVVKVDIEGSEVHLLKCPVEALTKVNEWLIEAHSGDLCSQIKEMFVSLGYRVFTVNFEDSILIIAHSRKLWKEERDHTKKRVRQSSKY
jgi:precorrin-6B methylase 2